MAQVRIVDVLSDFQAIYKKEPQKLIASIALEDDAHIEEINREIEGA